METIDYKKQAEDFCKETNTKVTIKFLKYDYHFQDDKDRRDIYRVRISRNSKSYSFNFGQSLNNSQFGNREIPSVYDVLSCITKDNPYSFEDFCSNFGYDNDSRKAYSTYKAVQREYEGIKRVFDVDGEGEHNTILNKLIEIQ